MSYCLLGPSICFLLWIRRHDCIIPPIFGASEAYCDRDEAMRLDWIICSSFTGWLLDLLQWAPPPRQFARREVSLQRRDGGFVSIVPGGECLPWRHNNNRGSPLSSTIPRIDQHDKLNGNDMVGFIMVQPLALWWFPSRPCHTTIILNIDRWLSITI